MSLLRRALVVLILAASVLAFPAARPAWACSCANVDYLQAAEVAFTGIAADVDPGPPWPTGTTVTVTFDVESAEKGEVGPRVELTTSSDGPSCGYEFIEGHRYRVFARDGATNLCHGNEDLGFVAAPRSAAPRSAVPAALWTTAGAVVIAAAAAAGYLWFRRRRAGQ